MLENFTAENRIKMPAFKGEGLPVVIDIDCFIIVRMTRAVVVNANIFINRKKRLVRLLAATKIHQPSPEPGDQSYQLLQQPPPDQEIRLPDCWIESFRNLLHSYALGFFKYC